MNKKCIDIVYTNKAIVLTLYIQNGIILFLCIYVVYTFLRFLEIYGGPT